MDFILSWTSRVLLSEHSISLILLFFPCFLCYFCKSVSPVQSCYVAMFMTNLWHFLAWEHFFLQPTVSMRLFNLEITFSLMYEDCTMTATLNLVSRCTWLSAGLKTGRMDVSEPVSQLDPWVVSNQLAIDTKPYLVISGLGCMYLIYAECGVHFGRRCLVMLV